MGVNVLRTQRQDGTGGESGNGEPPAGEVDRVDVGHLAEQRVQKRRNPRPVPRGEESKSKFAKLVWVVWFTHAVAIGAPRAQKFKRCYCSTSI